MSDSRPGAAAELRTAVLLSVGTELSDGVILNTHFRFLGATLKGMGLEVLKGVQVPDETEIFREELRRAVDGADLVLVTGGLGPTSDDLTREIVAEVAGARLEFHESLWESLVARYARGGGRAVPPANRKQAYIPAGFEVLPNSRGTAAGFCGRVGGALVAALPGPPAELEPMFLEELLPRLSPRVPAGGGGELVANVLLTSESVLEQSLQELRRKGEGGQEVLWGTRVTEDRIVLTLRGGSREQREGVLGALRGELGELLVRSGDERPVERLFRLLDSRGLTASFAESCTGGLLSKLLTDLPGSSRVFWGGVVAYDNAAKTRLLGVQPSLLEGSGAVSREAAEAMCSGLLQVSGTDLAAAVTGVAGPEGGSALKPVGSVWIAARMSSGAGRCLGFRFRGGRDMVRRRSAVAAFLLAECVLSGGDPSVLEELPG
ncbi:MAG: nicotinamide-nucleotide amidohydrolase family protein [Spirochaetales bacterium]|nr:nicotinamide-nucleotide amidohydrolase family protein [Spirochaetales bacterium]